MNLVSAMMLHHKPSLGSGARWQCPGTAVQFTHRAQPLLPPKPQLGCLHAGQQAALLRHYATAPKLLCHASSLAADSSPGKGDTSECGTVSVSIRAVVTSSCAGQTMQQVVLPTALVLMLCNMDRICMSVAMPVMARELAWAPSTQVVVMTSCAQI